MQAQPTFLFASPAPAHNYIFKGFGLCRRVLMCTISAKATELEETGSPQKGVRRSRTCVAVLWSPYFCADAVEYRWWLIFLLCP